MRHFRNRDGLTLGSGLTIGLLLTYRPWLVFAAGVLCGMLLPGARRLGQLAYNAMRKWATTVYAKRQAELAKAERIAAAPQRDEVPF